MRVSIHIDETDPSKPKPVLVVMGKELMLSECELRDLTAECGWAQDRLSVVRKQHWESLASKYKEVQDETA